MLLPLVELETTEAWPLTASQRDALRSAIPSLSVVPTRGFEDRYDITASGLVGALRVGDLDVEIRPKLPIDRVLFLVSYALDPRSWRDEPTPVDRDDHLLEAVVPTFVRLVRQTLRHGILHGYRTIDDTSTTVRGRIRIADQVRARPGLALPLELTYDDFTVDILENRLLATAVDRLLRLPLRHRSTRTSLVDLREQFAGVSLLPAALRPVPEPHWTRLNERYRLAVQLARLVLAGASVDVRAGKVSASGVLFDMPRLFEDFVVAALREQLGLDERSFLQGGGRRPPRLDVEHTVRLRPDISWWVDGRCLFAGDCKYKRNRSKGLHNADLYQLLAYLTALDLDEGVLVYAAGEREPRTRTVVNAGKRLTVATLDLRGKPPQVLAEVAELAERIRRLAGLRSPSASAGAQR